MFATVIKNAPLFNRKEISEIFLNFDKVHLIREIETILLHGSALTIIKKEGSVLEVLTDEYTSVNPLYIDQKFVNECDERPLERKKEMPSFHVMIERLLNFPKLPYIWGGNAPEGIPELLTYYPPKKELSSFDYIYWQLKGVDCSGLLYAITNGATLRNTSQIYAAYPQVASLKPLDLIVYPGHLLIALPDNKVIESRQYDGIVLSNQTARLKEIEHLEPRFVRLF